MANATIGESFFVPKPPTVPSAEIATAAITFYDTLYYANMPEHFQHSIFIPTAAFWEGGSFNYHYYLQLFKNEDGVLLMIDLERSSNEAEFLYEEIEGSPPSSADKLTYGYMKYLEHLRCKWSKIISEAIPLEIPTRADDTLLGFYYNGTELVTTGVLEGVNDGTRLIPEMEGPITDSPAGPIPPGSIIEAEYDGLKTYVQFMTPEMYRATESQLNWVASEIPRYLNSREVWEDEGTVVEVIPSINITYYGAAEDAGEWVTEEQFREMIANIIHAGCSKVWLHNFNYGSADVGAEYDESWPFAAVIKEYTPIAFPSNFAGYVPVTIPTSSECLYNVEVPISLNSFPEEWVAVVANNGSDIRCYNEIGIELPRDLISFQKQDTDVTGLLMVKYIGTITAASRIRVYAGDPTLTTPDVASANGQYAVYDSSVVGFWPDGGGDDRSSNQLSMTSSGEQSPGGALGPIGAHRGTLYDGATEYYALASGVPTAGPLSIFAAAKPTLDSNLNTVAAVSKNGTDDHYFWLALDGATAGDPARFISRDTTTRDLAIGDYAAATWCVLMGENISSVNYNVYFNELSNNRTTSVTPTGLDRFSIGARLTTTTPTGYFGGTISYVWLCNEAKGEAWYDYQRRALNADFLSVGAYVEYTPPT